jgi:hypothetical protein
MKDKRKNHMEIVLLILLITGCFALSQVLKRYFNKLPPRTYNIVVLGPRGVGKTTILAGVLYLFERIAEGHSVTGSDGLDGLRMEPEVETSYKVRQARNQIRKIETLIQEASNVRVPVEGIMPPIAPTGKLDLMTFYVSSSDHQPSLERTLTLNFVDYPGGLVSSMSASDSPDRDKVIAALRDAKVILVVVDGPYLMEKDGRYHQDRNEVADVKRALRSSGAFESGDGLLLFVVTRCEKYLNLNQGAEMCRRVRGEYREILEYFALPKYQGRVRVAVTPVATVGCLEFDSFSDSSPYTNGVPSPIFLPLGTIEQRKYAPRHMEQIAWRLLLHVLWESSRDAGGKTAAKFRDALPKLWQHVLETEGFQTIQQGPY